MIEFTKEEIQQSINNLDRALKALRELILEEYSPYTREALEVRYNETAKRKKELDEMLK